jgi:hypothetical protein
MSDLATGKLATQHGITDGTILRVQIDSFQLQQAEADILPAALLDLQTLQLHGFIERRAVGIAQRRTDSVRLQVIDSA